ncbi:MerR family transcriptional regulator [Paenibacillus sp. SI8]|uniref:MerR family transcriptional regulator n=1 Tax=unclassified Paenibacillus TaxID=185978 RepID=UPI003465CF62
MSEMIKIGLFSKIAQVTIRTLRHYDEIGLIKPIWIDPQTNYRFYAYEQLSLVHQIQALKDIGLSLEQIKDMIDGQISIDATIRILADHKTLIVNELREKNEQLNRIDSRLNQLRHIGQQPKYEIVLKQVPSLFVASTRRIVPLPMDMPLYRCEMFNDLERWLLQNDCLMDQEYVFYHMSEFIETDFDIEAAVSIQMNQKNLAATDTIQLRELPSEPLVASLIHRGKFMDVGEALSELFKWLGFNGYSPTGSVREIHLFGRENHCRNYNDVLVELQIPVAKNV